MISHEHRFIFIHIPKTAGTSIEAALGHEQEYAGRQSQDHRTLRQYAPLRLSTDRFLPLTNLAETLRAIKSRYRRHRNPRNTRQVSAEQYASYYRFSFVRNPWARVYSWYRNVMTDPVQLRNHGLSEPISFEQFLKEHSASWALRPQMYWLKDFTGRVNLDFVGRFEHLEHDFRIVCRELGIPVRELPHKVRGTHSEFRTHYSRPLRDLIQARYAAEIEQFRYTFEHCDPDDAA